jgi:hypothetical protein
MRYAPLLILAAAPAADSTLFRVTFASVVQRFLGTANDHPGQVSLFPQKVAGRQRLRGREM